MNSFHPYCVSHVCHGSVTCLQIHIIDKVKKSYMNTKRQSLVARVYYFAIYDNVLDGLKSILLGWRI